MPAKRVVPWNAEAKQPKRQAGSTGGLVVSTNPPVQPVNTNPQVLAADPEAATGKVLAADPEAATGCKADAKPSAPPALVAPAVKELFALRQSPDASVSETEAYFEAHVVPRIKDDLAEVFAAGPVGLGGIEAYCKETRVLEGVGFRKGGGG